MADWQKKSPLPSTQSKEKTTSSAVNAIKSKPKKSKSIKLQAVRQRNDKKAMSSSPKGNQSGPRRRKIKHRLRRPPRQESYNHYNHYYMNMIFKGTITEWKTQSGTKVGGLINLEGESSMIEFKCSELSKYSVSDHNLDLLPVAITCKVSDVNGERYAKCIRVKSFENQDKELIGIVTMVPSASPPISGILYCSSNKLVYRFSDEERMRNRISHCRVNQIVQLQEFPRRHRGERLACKVTPVKTLSDEAVRAYCLNEVGQCHVNSTYFIPGTEIDVREDLYHEFKDLNVNLEYGNDVKRCVHVIGKYMNAFMNSKGGILFIGIRDHGDIRGVPRVTREVEDNIRKSITNEVIQWRPRLQTPLSNGYNIEFVGVVNKLPDGSYYVTPNTKVIMITVKPIYCRLQRGQQRTRDQIIFKLTQKGNGDQHPDDWETFYKTSSGYRTKSGRIDEQSANFRGRVWVPPNNMLEFAIRNKLKNQKVHNQHPPQPILQQPLQPLENRNAPHPKSPPLYDHEHAESAKKKAATVMMKKCTLNSKSSMDTLPEIMFVGSATGPAVSSQLLLPEKGSVSPVHHTTTTITTERTLKNQGTQTVVDCNDEEKQEKKEEKDKQVMECNIQNIIKSPPKLPVSPISNLLQSHTPSPICSSSPNQTDAVKRGSNDSLPCRLSLPPQMQSTHDDEDENEDDHERKVSVHKKNAKSHSKKGGKTKAVKGSKGKSKKKGPKVTDKNKVREIEQVVVDWLFDKTRTSIQTPSEISSVVVFSSHLEFSKFLHIILCDAVQNIADDADHFAEKMKQLSIAMQSTSGHGRWCWLKKAKRETEAMDDMFFEKSLIWSCTRLLSDQRSFLLESGAAWEVADQFKGMMMAFGELLNCKLLTNDFIHNAIESLLPTSKHNLEPVLIEALCVLLETCGKTLDSDDANHVQILQYIENTKQFIDSDYFTTQSIARLERMIQNQWDEDIADHDGSVDFDQMFGVIGDDFTVADKVKQYMLLESDLEKIPAELIKKLAATDNDMQKVIDAVLEMAVDSTDSLTRCVNILIDLAVNFDKLQLSWVPNGDDEERKEVDDNENDEHQSTSDLFVGMLTWQCEDFCVQLRSKCNDWQWQPSGYDFGRDRDEDQKVFIRSIKLCGALFKAGVLNLESGDVIDSLMKSNNGNIAAIDVEALYLLLTICGKHLYEEAHPVIVKNVEMMKQMVARGGFEFRTTFMIQQLSELIKKNGWSTQM